MVKLTDDEEERLALYKKMRDNAKETNKEKAFRAFSVKVEQLESKIKRNPRRKIDFIIWE